MPINFDPAVTLSQDRQVFNMKFLIVIGVAFLCGRSCAVTEGCKWVVGQPVRTTSGLVTGHSSASNADVSEYLGIPFAQPPVESLRWAAPVPFSGVNVINGSGYGRSCPSPISNGTNFSAKGILAANLTKTGLRILQQSATQATVSGEDCLYLNVWTRPQTGDVNKAVMIWLYGGGFYTGSSSDSSYDGAALASMEDVVVVSFNYRLSILGFPGNPVGKENLGLLDQRLAVQWVRDNIANFGGDPARITLFGQSAGSVSVDIYSYAWQDDPIAAGFIEESGTAFSWGLPHSKETAGNAWYNVTETIGCGGPSDDPDVVFSCMQCKGTDEIMKAVPVITGPPSAFPLFGPTVDETIVFSNYSQRKPSSLPLLIGNNDYEAGLFRTDYALQGMTFPDYWWDDFDLQLFTCPAGIRANASIASGSSVWRYRYFGIFPDLTISTEAGCYHGSEIPIIFNTTVSKPPRTIQELEVANYIRTAWATFAKDPFSGLTSYGWPKYAAADHSNTLIRLAYNNKIGINAAPPYSYDRQCPYVNVSSTNTDAFQPLPNIG